jgi:hypothetical protein
VRHLGEPWVVIDMKKILQSGQVDNVQGDKDILRDDMTYYRDGPHLASDSTFMEMIMRVTYDTYWAGYPVDLCEFGAPQETGLFFSRVSKL